MSAERNIRSVQQGLPAGRLKLAIARSLAGVAALTVCGAALAQQAPGAAPAAKGELEEIVVTATKRQQSIQEVPIAITALSSDDLQKLGATAFADYATTVPNLSFGYAGAGRTVARQFQIRGLFGAGTSALYIDDTPVPVTMDPRVLDVERIEVLRGPQGSLFGSRSMGGLVRMITKQPDTEDFSSKVHVRGGSIADGAEDYLVDGSVNLPMADGRAALRASAYYVRDGGFVDRFVDPDASYWGRPASKAQLSGDEYVAKDVNTDKTWGAQLAVKFQATDDITITPSVMYQKLDSDSPPFVELDPDSGSVTRQFNFDEWSEDEWYLGALLMEFRFSAGTLVSSTSYFNRKTADMEDGTLAVEPPYNGSSVPPRWVVGTVPVETLQEGDLDLVTQELRFVSEASGPFSYIVGGFYQHQDNHGGYPPLSILEAGTQLVFFGLPAGESFFSQTAHTTSREIGVFGELSYAFTPTWTATVGGRYYDYESTANRTDDGTLYYLVGLEPPIVSGEFKQSETGFNPKVGLQWRASESAMIYADAAKGFRPGGTNPGATACEAVGVTGVPATFDSDSVWSYELGGKADWADRRLVTNLSVYYVKWNDYRASVVCPLGFGYSVNTGEAESKGFELELTAYPVDGLTVALSVGYTDAQITDPGTSTRIHTGDPLVNVPEWTGMFSIDHSFAMTDTARGYWRVDYRYVGDSVGLISLANSNGAIPTDPSTRNRPSYDLVNARIGIRRDHMDAAIYIDNVTNERANLANPTPVSDALPLVAVNRPRTVGIDFRYSF